MLIVDMRSPGVEVRPMTQITGHAEFCELFLDDVVVPKENLLSERGDGWKIAMHALGHERGTAALPRQVKLRTWLDRPVRVAAERELDGAAAPRRSSGAGRARARARIGIEVLRHHAYRTVGEFLNGGAVGPDSSSVKLLMAEAEQRLAATALELLGPTLQHADPAARRRGRVLARDVSLLARRERSMAARGRSSATSSPTAFSASRRNSHGPRADRRADLAGGVDRHAARARVVRREAVDAGIDRDGAFGRSSSRSARSASAARTGSAPWSSA